jgi:Skp family chaperone for outer membrane proteins
MKYLLLPALLLAAFAAGVQADRAIPSASETVRFVDMGRCLQQLPALTDGLGAVQAKYAAEGERLQAIAEDLRAREAELAQLDPDSQAYVVGQLRIEADKTAAQREAEFLRSRQAQEADALLDRTVRAIHAAAARLAEREGFGSVMMKPGPFLDLERAGVSDSLDDLEQRWVVWAHPDHDVTDAVLAILAEEG